MNRNAEPKTEALNRLYWESDASVGEIAEQLGVSRRALYEALRPAPAGRTCPECGGPLAFTTRSARAQGQGVCLQCGAAHKLDAEPAAAPAPVPEATVPEYHSRLLLVSFAALAGFAAGVLAARLLTRRI